LERRHGDGSKWKGKGDKVGYICGETLGECLVTAGRKSNIEKSALLTALSIGEVACEEETEMSSSTSEVTGSVVDVDADGAMGRV
jgi:hypothetical protein